MSRDYFVKMYFEDLPYDKMAKEPLSDREQAMLELFNSGGIGLYMYLVNHCARSNWNDHDGYPLKRLYYDKGLLACTYSVKTLMDITGMGERKIKKYIKLLLSVDWIKKERKTRKGQNVFILGRYEGKAPNEKYFLFKDEVTESKEVEKEEGIKDATKMGDVNFNKYMLETYGEAYLTKVS